MSIPGQPTARTSGTSKDLAYEVDAEEEDERNGSEGLRCARCFKEIDVAALTSRVTQEIRRHLEQHGAAVELDEFDEPDDFDDFDGLGPAVNCPECDADLREENSLREGWTGSGAEYAHVEDGFYTFDTEDEERDALGLCCTSCDTVIDLEALGVER